MKMIFFRLLSPTLVHQLGIIFLLNDGQQSSVEIQASPIGCSLGLLTYGQIAILIW